MNRSFFMCIALIQSMTFALTGFDSAYVVKDDICAVEAEDCTYGSKWVMEKNVAGFSGRGYLRYTGPDNTCTAGKPSDVEMCWDNTGACQVDNGNRIRIPVYIPTDGAYNLNVFCYPTQIGSLGGGMDAHVAGRDHTAWLHVEGQKQVAGMGHTPEGVKNKWTFFSFGPGSNEYGRGQVWFALKKGYYVFYVGGRHSNFKADRIHIYRTTGLNKYPLLSTSPTLPLASKVPIISTHIQTPKITAVETPIRFSQTGSSLTVSPQQQIDVLRIYSIQGHKQAAISQSTARVKLPCGTYLAAFERGGVVGKMVLFTVKAPVRSISLN